MGGEATAWGRLRLLHLEALGGRERRPGAEVSCDDVEASMIDATTAPYGMLILRVCFGMMFIAHALFKATVFDFLDGVMDDDFPPFE